MVFAHVLLHTPNIITHLPYHLLKRVSTLLSDHFDQSIDINKWPLSDC